MKNAIKIAAISAFCATLFLVSCGKDKPLTSQSNETTIKKEGNIYSP